MSFKTKLLRVAVECRRRMFIRVVVVNLVSRVAVVRTHLLLLESLTIAHLKITISFTSLDS